MRDQGVTGLGIRAVARCAGVSHNAPSRHFPNHTALCNAVATVGFAEFSDALEAAMTGIVDPFDRLCAQAGAYVRFGLEHAAMFDLMWHSDVVDRNDPDLGATALRSFMLLRDAIVQCQAQGWNVHSEPDTLAGLLWSWVHGLTKLWSTASMPIFAMPDDLDIHLRNGFTVFGLPMKEHQS